MLSYIALLIMATGVSTYSILQLGQMRGITHSIILLDTNLLDLHKNMADALLSASRYEKNITVMWDPALYESFLASKKDFERYLEEAMALAESGEMHQVLVQAGGEAPGLSGALCGRGCPAGGRRSSS